MDQPFVQVLGLKSKKNVRCEEITGQTAKPSEVHAKARLNIQEIYQGEISTREFPQPPGSSA